MMSGSLTKEATCMHDVKEQHNEQQLGEDACMHDIGESLDLTDSYVIMPKKNWDARL